MLCNLVVPVGPMLHLPAELWSIVLSHVALRHPDCLRAFLCSHSGAAQAVDYSILIAPLTAPPCAIAPKPCDGHVQGELESQLSGLDTFKTLLAYAASGDLYADLSPNDDSHLLRIELS